MEDGDSPQRSFIALVLLTIELLQPYNAFGSNIAETMREHIDVKSVAQVYVVLKRLESAGLIVRTSILKERKKGRPRVLYVVTAKGKEANERVLSLAQRVVAKRSNHVKTAQP
jgi:DNA-binding PadR family transcriptional regulator